MRRNLRSLRVAAGLLLLAVGLAACRDADPEQVAPSVSDSVPDLPGLPTPGPTTTGSPSVTFSQRSDGCVEPDREDWRSFMQASGLGDLDGDGEDEFVYHHPDRRSAVRGIIETDDGLVPIRDAATDGTLTGLPEPGPIVRLGSRVLVAAELGGAPDVDLGFFTVDGCDAELVPVAGEPGGMAYATTGTDCLPECGVGLTCVGSVIRQVRWQVFVRGENGTPVPWEEVANDPSVRSDDLRARVMTTDYRLGSGGFQPGATTEYVTVITDGRLPALRDGFECDGLQLHPFLRELNGFGIDPEVFDAERDEL